MFDWIYDRYYRWKHGWPKPRSAKWERAARDRGLFPAFADWGGGLALDRTGEVWRSEEPDQWLNPSVETDHQLRFAALGIAVRRYPALSYLTPRRGPDDPVCPTCEGRGYPAKLPPKLRYWIMCQCGGLGWIPRAVAQLADPARA